MALTDEYLMDVQRSLGLSDEELAEIHEAFILFDVDKNGYIDQTELRRLMNILGQDYSKQEIEQIIEQLDVVEKDGRIEFKEFVIFMKENSKDKKTREQELRDAFKVFDEDGNGKIDEFELKNVLGKFGDKLSDAEIKEMINEADVDGDGKISYDEFVELFMKDFKDFN